MVSAWGEVLAYLKKDVYVNRRPGNTGRRMFDVAADIICQHLLPRMFHRWVIGAQPGNLVTPRFMQKA